MADKLFKYHFKIRVVLDNGNTATMSGEVYDVAGAPVSAFEKVKEACAKSVGPPSLYDDARITMRQNKQPVRRIKIIHEPPMEGIEKCFFCKQPTRWWNKKRNQPVCPECATTHTPDELQSDAMLKASHLAGQ